MDPGLLPRSLHVPPKVGLQLGQVFRGIPTGP